MHYFALDLTASTQPDSLASA